jgi:hypothetical protein
MKIDVAINVTANAISVKSRIANYIETRNCRIALSKVIGEKFEVVEDVGRDWTTESITVAAIDERGNKNRNYRVINPFVPQSFETYPASMMIDFFCRKTFYTIKPSRGDWRLLFGFDSYELKLRIESYLLVSTEKKSEFEKLLSKITRKYQIEQ